MNVVVVIAFFVSSLGFGCCQSNSADSSLLEKFRQSEARLVEEFRGGSAQHYHEKRKRVFGELLAEADPTDREAGNVLGLALCREAVGDYHGASSCAESISSESEHYAESRLVVFRSCARKKAYKRLVRELDAYVQANPENGLELTGPFYGLLFLNWTQEVSQEERVSCFVKYMHYHQEHSELWINYRYLLERSVLFGVEEALDVDRHIAAILAARREVLAGSKDSRLTDDQVQRLIVCDTALLLLSPKDDLNKRVHEAVGHLNSVCASQSSLPLESFQVLVQGVCDAILDAAMSDAGDATAIEDELQLGCMRLESQFDDYSRICFLKLSEVKRRIECARSHLKDLQFDEHIPIAVCDVFQRHKPVLDSIEGRFELNGIEVQVVPSKKLQENSSIVSDELRILLSKPIWFFRVKLKDERIVQCGFRTMKRIFELAEELDDFAANRR